jgi:hypothetical protein
MNWYALVDGRLVCIGNCGDWDAAYEVAVNSIGEVEWQWLASEKDVQQWADCLQENR